MHPQFLVWCLTFGAQFKNDGHYFCRAGGNRPDGLNEPVTISINDGALKYHWYNLVKNILRMRTYHVVTQLCT
ncbi:hypothetical protein D6N28_03690 [Salmonella enterica]|nr:hypothetical protein [Salmonella enterica]